MNNDSGEISLESWHKFAGIRKNLASFCFFFFFFFSLFLGPKLIGEEQIWPGTWCQRRGFAGCHWIPAISWDSDQFSRFCRIPTRFRQNHCSWFAEITVEDMLETKKLLLRAFWEKVPTLRNFETSGGNIVNF
jgi:hypothetical protein